MQLYGKKEYWLMEYESTEYIVEYEQMVQSAGEIQDIYRKDDHEQPPEDVSAKIAERFYAEY